MNKEPHYTYYHSLSIYLYNIPLPVTQTLPNFVRVHCRALKMRVSDAFEKLQEATISFVMSVCPSVSLSVCPSAWFNSAATGRIFMKFNTYVFSKICRENFKFHQNLTRTSDTLREDNYRILKISRSVLLRMKNVSDKSCRENWNTHSIINNVSFP